MHHQLEVEPRAVDIGAQITGRIRLVDGGLQSPQHRDHLAANVDERVVCADRVCRDDRALDEEVRRGQDQWNVFARTGFGLVGVDDEILRLRACTGVVLRDEGPLRSGREARTAAAAQTRVLHKGDDLVGLHRERLLQRAVAVVTAVGVHRPGFGVVPVPAEHGGEWGSRCHVSRVSPFCSGRFLWCRLRRARWPTVPGPVRPWWSRRPRRSVPSDFGGGALTSARGRRLHVEFAGDPQPGQRRGRYLAAHGDRAVVGQPGEDSGGLLERAQRRAAAGHDFLARPQ